MHSFRIGRYFPIQTCTNCYELEITKLMRAGFPDILDWLKSEPRQPWRLHYENAVDQHHTQFPRQGLFWAINLWVVFDCKKDASLFALFFEDNDTVVQEAVRWPSHTF